MFILKRGSEGQEVKRMQGIIDATPDGDFGSKTETALKEYQTCHGLVADGIYGWKTQESMGTEVWAGIDVSSHNGVIDWEKVGKTNNKFAVIKLTEGRTHKNRRRKTNWNGAKENGLLVGGYHFGRPDTDKGPSDAVAEAKSFIKQLEYVGWERGVDLVPVLDAEAGMKTDDQYNAEWCTIFCEYMEAELGVKPIIYTAKWYWNAYLKNANRLTLAKLCTYPVWWADYNAKNPVNPNLRGWNDWDIWQWTGYGSCSGMKGRVDQNWLPGGKEALERLKGLRNCCGTSPDCCDCC